MSKEKLNIKKPSFLARFKTFLILALSVLAIGLYLYKEMQVKRTAKQYELQQEKMKIEVSNFVSEENELFLRLLMKPFVWAVRSEMLKNNYDQIDNYIRDIVKDPHFETIAVADTAGIILLCSNKKLEGEKLKNKFTKVDVNAPQIRIYDHNNVLEVITPIMGFDQRLGSLFAVYVPDSLELKIINK